MPWPTTYFHFQPVDPNSWSQYLVPGTRFGDTQRTRGMYTRLFVLRRHFPATNNDSRRRYKRANYNSQLSTREKPRQFTFNFRFVFISAQRCGFFVPLFPRSRTA